ncbi:nucleobase:cation symporter-2 family protein [Thermoactinomyces mirandus]|uniref:Purine permease n=1 Tax=Thermoactinomyces mirandus TaxID=2756294 RepID=A0A7W1XSU8_9BACL|nr:nucleobase:cation symporter-2 family protein [Thermoactinomyces mirandus]MBA4602637.1 purine permease [Thermoactinomyces mirandus]
MLNRYHRLKIALLGFQHVLAMYTGAVAVPLVIGNALKLTPMQIAYLIAIDLVTSGVATLLQIFRNRFSGIGLPVVLGCTFTAVGPIIAIGSQFGMAAVYGAIIVSGIILLFFSGILGKLVQSLPPVVIGTVVTIIGLTLIPVAINNIAGGEGSPDFGAPSNLLLGFGVLILILILYRLFDGFTRSISVLIGLIAGTIIACFMDKVDLSTVRQASWFHMPRPFFFQTPAFEASAIFMMVLVSLISMIESTGVFLALGKICNQPLKSQDLTRGYRAEGIATIIGGIFNAFPYTTFSQNVGLVQLSQVKSRHVVAVAGFILILLGLVPKIAAITTIIPPAVLGGAMIAMFGMVIASGIHILSDIDFNSNENLLIIACSIGMGLGVTAVPDLFRALPENLQLLTNSGIVTGSVTAVAMHLLFRLLRGVKKKSPSIQQSS